MGQLTIIDEREVLGRDFRIYGTPEEPLFLAKDVATWIEHSNPTEMVRTIDDAEKLNSTIFSSGQNREVTFLTEDGLYEVLMQSRKPIAKEFKKQVKDILKSIRKTGSYAIPTMSQAELTAMIAQNQVTIERTANRALEIASRADKQINNALDIFTTPPEDNWRESMNRRMRGMCEQYKLNYPVFYGDLYAELEALAKADLKARLTKLRNRMTANGATKTECKGVTKLEIIERDPKLKPIFESIVRKYQAKYVLDKNVEVKGGDLVGVQ